MNREAIEIILKGNLEQGPLTEEEKEIALKILNDLEGTLVIRATSILELCLKAILYSRIGTVNFKTLNQMRSNYGLESIADGEVFLIHSAKNKLP